MGVYLGKKILIIEDESSLRNILKGSLEQVGFVVLTAEDGVKGLEIALAKKPDLVLLDVLMPKMNGLKTLKNLREDASWGKTVPVILLSNDDDPEHIQETLKDSATDYLIKSDWKLEEVVKKIKETLRL